MENGGEMKPIIIVVPGQPVAKQSTRFDGQGRAHTPQRVKDWQETVAWYARIAMGGREPLSGPVGMRIVFILKNHKRVDLDNLCKAINDSLNGIVFQDDNQVFSLHLMKRVSSKNTPGVAIVIVEGMELPSAIAK